MYRYVGLQIRRLMSLGKTTPLELHLANLDRFKKSDEEEVVKPTSQCSSFLYTSPPYSISKRCTTLSHDVEDPGDDARRKGVISFHSVCVFFSYLLITKIEDFSSMLVGCVHYSVCLL